MKKRSRTFLIIGAGLVLVIFIIIAVASNQEKLIPVTVEQPQKGKIISIVTANGKVEAETDVNISADVMGRITNLPVVEGQHVKRGDLLVEIDRTQKEADVAQMRAALASARVNLEQAELNFGRQEPLHERGGISDAEYDLAKTELDRARAAVAQAEANLARAEDQLAKCTIRAPISGTITTLNSEEGENVIIGTMNNLGTVIMVISDLSKIVVKADVDETDIARLALAQDVKISLDAFPDTTFVGKVTDIGNAAKLTGVAQEQVTNFEVTILITDKVPNIKPGMNATVDITTDIRNDVVKIPIQAVVMREDTALNKKEDEKKVGSMTTEANAEESVETLEEENSGEAGEKEIEGVFVVKDNTAEFVPVTTGISDQQYIEIKSGLNPDQKVITGSYKTLRTLRDGDKVKPSEKKFENFGS
jgi:HlyD family secretion protein